MRILARIQFALLVPSIALVALAFRRGSPEPPPQAQSSALSWRTLHRHGGEPRGQNGLGVTFQEARGSGSRIYAMASGHSLRSEDGGATWTELPRVHSCWSVALRDDGLAMVGCGGRIFRSTDGLSDWAEIDIPEDRPVGTISLEGEESIAAGRSILRSTDAGATWKRVKAPAVNIGDVARRGSTILAVGGAGFVARSGDGGTTWQHRWLPTKAVLTSVAFSDDQAAVILTFDGILRSADGGRSGRELGRSNSQH